MNGGNDIAKAGWIYRQSSVLHRWKRNWFVLYRDGLLRYYESQNSSYAEDVIVVRSKCDGINTEVRGVKPPEEVRDGLSCLFEMKMRDGGHLMLCAETQDDMRAWQYALEEARSMVPPAGPVPVVPFPQPYGYGFHHVSYDGYPGQVISPPQPQVIQTPQGTTTIINQSPQMLIMEDPYPYHRRGRRGYGGRYYQNPGTFYPATPRYM